MRVARTLEVQDRWRRRQCPLSVIFSFAVPSAGSDVRLCPPGDDFMLLMS